LLIFYLENRREKQENTWRIEEKNRRIPGE